MYCCVYYKKGVDTRIEYSHWLTVCKKYLIRFVYLTKPSDLPDSYKHHMVGLIPDGNLFCIANMTSTVMDWTPVAAECPNLIIEPVRDLSDIEAERLCEFFDARVKFKKDKKGRFFIEKQKGAPLLPSAQLVIQSKDLEFRAAVSECKQIDKIAYRDVLDEACGYLFDIVNERYGRVLSSIIELSQSFDRFFAKRDRTMCEQCRWEIIAMARKYCNWATVNKENICQKSLEKHNTLLFDFIISHPTYAKYYHAPGSSSEYNIHQWTKALDNWFNNNFIGQTGLKLFYEDYKAFLTEIGMANMLNVTTFPDLPPPLKKPRIIFPH